MDERRLHEPPRCRDRRGYTRQRKRPGIRPHYWVNAIRASPDALPVEFIAEHSTRISLGRWGVGTPMYRYRLIDQDGTDLGPLISPRITFAVGQDIARRTDERYEILRVVEPENESFRAYLIVRSS